MFAIYTDICDIQLHFQNFMRLNNNRVAGRSLDTPDLYHQATETESCEKDKT